MSKLPKLRFKEFSGDWESKKLGEFLIESKIKGSTGENSKKLTVKLWGKGIVAKKEILKGSSSTQYYVRKSGQLMYGKLDFLNCAFGIVPKYLDGYESTIDSPAFDVKNANANFLLNKITQKNFYKKYGDIADGSRKAKRVHSETFLNMDINIPSLKEQEKIASFLSLVDEKINLQDKKLENLKNYKKGIMSKIFKRELKFKDNNGNNYPKWEITKIEDIAHIEKGFTPSTSNEKNWTGDILWLSISDMKQQKYISNVSKFISKEALGNKKLVTKGTLVMSFKLTLGRLAIINTPLITNEAICHFYWKNNNIDTEYMYYYLNTVNITSFGSRATKGVTLNNDSINSIVVNLPCLDEQIKISSFLSLIDEKIEKEAKKLDLLNDYKKGLLQQMFV